ncbi:MAG: HlyD family secretion protein [Pirellula sp.]|jgi:multidrug resistance efflux pump|nr:HlyD family secretion protein [Pirellula sp.]
MRTRVDQEPNQAQQHTIRSKKRMIRYRPSEMLAENFPAMHLVRSSWFARSLANITFYLLLLFVFAGIFVPWQQTSRCEGMVTARNPNERRQVFLSAAKGVIKWQKDQLQEGSLVEQGEKLMEIETLAKDQLELTRLQEKTVRDKIAYLESQLSFARTQVTDSIESGDKQITSAQSEIAGAYAKWKSAEASTDAQENKAKQAQVNVQTIQPLRGITVSELEYMQAKTEEEIESNNLKKAREAESEAFHEKVAKEELLDSKRREIAIKINQSEQKVQEFRGKIAEASKELQDVIVKIGELERTQVLSPNTGSVQSILGQVGKNVDIGEPLFEIIPETDYLWVELSVRGMDQPLIKVGDKVRLQFDGWPAIQFVGWPSAARGTFGGIVIAINPADDGKGNFKVFVGPDPSDPIQERWPDRRYLKQGVRANAWIIMDSVPLGFEIWRQLNGFPPARENADEEMSKEKEIKKPKVK